MDFYNFLIGKSKRIVTPLPGSLVTLFTIDQPLSEPKSALSTDE